MLGSPLALLSSVSMQIPVCKILSLSFFFLTVCNLLQQLTFHLLFLKAVLWGASDNPKNPKCVLQYFAPSHPHLSAQHTPVKAGPLPSASLRGQRGAIQLSSRVSSLGWRSSPLWLHPGCHLQPFGAHRGWPLLQHGL